MTGRTLALSTLTLIAATTAIAQIPGLPQMPNIEYNPLLLINPQVQKELHLSPTNASKVQSAFMQDAMKILPILSSQPGNAKATAPERTRRMLAAIDQMQAHLAGMLTPPQRARLRELTLQSIGPSAALQPRVAATLGLTGGQKARLSEAISDSNQKVASQMQNGKSVRDWQQRMPEMTRLQNEAKAEGTRALMATLTPVQRAKWRAMLGKPFNLSGFLGVGALGVGR